MSEVSGPVDRELDEHEFNGSCRLDTDVCAELVTVDHVRRVQRVVGHDDEGVDTAAGLLAKRLGIVPIPGAHVRINNWILTAESAAGRRHRIGTVLVARDEYLGNSEETANE